jgi:mannose-6-phosphate isomerase-like protein (cupin superfamily)
MRSVLSCLLLAAPLLAADRPVDPTWLHKFVPDVPAKVVDAAAPGCRYKAIFGEDDANARILRGIARFGEWIVESGASCSPPVLPREEQIYLVLDGGGDVQYGSERVPVRKNDYMYLPPGVGRGVSNKSGAELRVLVMGYRIPEDVKITVPSGPQKANIDEVKKQTVGGHPPTVLYQLLMGDTTSDRDRIAAAHVMTSLFIMTFEPGGTNAPHHHDTEEEIYLVLDGEGEMVAGGGMNGVEGRHPAKPGDAFFFRLNCTVGFYSSTAPGNKARILAVRSRYPFGRR